MVAFSIIGLLLLVVIFLILRNKSIQSELSQVKFALKTLDNQNKYSFNALVMVSGQMQNSYLAKLEAKRKHALISTEDYNIANFILSQVEYVISRCCEHNATVEESINKALENGAFDAESVRKYIAKQSSDIRMSWCKNTLGGFITACHLLSSQPTSSKDKSAEGTTPPNDQQSA